MTQALDYPSQPVSIAPPRKRLDSLDLLRGTSILGIFLMNTVCMSMPSAAYDNPSVYGDFHGLNYWAYVIIHIVADMKFITIFSIMFGAGIALQAERSALRGLSPAGVHYRRMGILLLIGIAHAYLLWFGDILVVYCMCGMLLFPVRRLPGPMLIAAGAIFIGLGSVVDYQINRVELWQQSVYDNVSAASDLNLDQNGDVDPADTYVDPSGAVTFRTLPKWLKPVEMIMDLSNSLVGSRVGNEIELHAYRDGWRAEMRNRPWLSFENETSGFLDFTLWRCGGAMLIGMGLHRLKFFHAGWGASVYAGLAAFAIPTGWMITIVGLFFNSMYQWNAADLSFPGLQFNYWGSLIAAFGYISLGTLVAIRAAEYGRWILAKLVIPIRAVGRTALSNYIMQSLIGTTIFYGHGFGYYGFVSRFGLVGIVLCVWAFQLTISTLSTRRFRQGPLEWLWHRAVYWRGYENA